MKIPVDWRRKFESGALLCSHSAICSFLLLPESKNPICLQGGHIRKMHVNPSLQYCLWLILTVALSEWSFLWVTTAKFVLPSEYQLALGSWGRRRSSSDPTLEQTWEIEAKQKRKRNHITRCPGFDWDRVNFPPSSCCVLVLVQEEWW